MGRIRKYILSWKPSKSGQVVGYRLYWSIGSTASYASDYIELGNITEVNVTEVLADICPSEKPIYLGITSIDNFGNESDITPLSEPYYMSVPVAPEDLVLTRTDWYEIDSSKTIVKNLTQEAKNHSSDQSDKAVRKNPSGPMPKFVTTEGTIVEEFDYKAVKNLKD